MLFPDGAKDKIRILFRFLFQFRLSAIQKAFAPKTAWSDGYFWLIHIVTGAHQVFFHIQQDLDPYLLVRLQYPIEYLIGGEAKSDGY